MNSRASPKVSVLVPNLNMRPFLPERFASIRQQTLRDWEVYALDSHSSDGSWDYIQEMTRSDTRIRAAQAPKEGPYPAWNRCLAATSGEYVYVATSDDSMAGDCLEKLAAALDRHPECDLAHCGLRIVDRDGRPTSWPQWPHETVFTEGLPGIEGLPHIRRAPHDALLHLSGSHVYLSVAQLLIRRSLFSKIGDFPNRWGNFSDFNWEMRACLATDTVHVPTTWVSWRIHPNQATAQNLISAERSRAIDEMINDALVSCGPYCPTLGAHGTLIGRSQELRRYYSDIGNGRTGIGRRVSQILHLAFGPNSVRREMLAVARGRKWPAGLGETIRRTIAESRGSPAIQRLDS